MGRRSRGVSAPGPPGQRPRPRRRLFRGARAGTTRLQPRQVVFAQCRACEVAAARCEKFAHQRRAIEAGTPSRRKPSSGFSGTCHPRRRPEAAFDSTWRLVSSSSATSSSASGRKSWIPRLRRDDGWPAPTQTRRRLDRRLFVSCTSTNRRGHILPAISFARVRCASTALRESARCCLTSSRVAAGIILRSMASSASWWPFTIASM